MSENVNYGDPTAFIGIAEGVRSRVEWASAGQQLISGRREIEEEFGENCPEYIDGADEWPPEVNDSQSGEWRVYKSNKAKESERDLLAAFFGNRCRRSPTLPSVLSM